MKPRWVSLEPHRERNRAPLSFCSGKGSGLTVRQMLAALACRAAEI